jgi:hypothetical protein
MQNNFRTLGILLLLFTAAQVTAQNYQWAKPVGGPNDQVCMDMAVDAHGAVYLIGNLAGTQVDFDPGEGTSLLSSSGGTDIFFAKYDSLGNYCWAHSVGGTGEDIGARISLDQDGNVLITGWFASLNADFDPGPGSALLSTAGQTDIYLGSYDPDGNYRWAFNIGTVLGEGGHDICTDQSGHFFITGYFQGTNVDFDPGPGSVLLSSIGNSGDIFIAKYHTDGTLVWAKSAGGAAYEVGNGISVDHSGNVLVAGPFKGTVDFDPGSGTASLTSSGGYDIFVAKYDSSGNYLWAFLVGGNGDDNAGDVTTDVNDNVVFCASFHGTDIDFDPGPGTALLSSLGGSDCSVAKYDPAGNYLWAGRFGGQQDDWIIKVRTDASGNIFHTGAFRDTNVDFDPGAGVAPLSSGGQEDIFFSEWDGNGLLVWAKRIGGAYSDWGNTIGLTAEGDIRLAGNFTGTNIDFDPGEGIALLTSKGGADIFFGGYSHTVTAVEEPGGRPRGDSGSLRVFPNPASGKTTIEFSLSTPGTCRIFMSDITGNRIIKILESECGTGLHSVEADFSSFSAGIYLCTIETPSGQKTSRVILGK